MEARTLHQWEGAVFYLHLDAIKLFQHGRNIQQVENDGLVGAQEGTVANQRNDRVADITCSSSDQNTNRLSLVLSQTDKFMQNTHKEAKTATLIVRPQRWPSRFSGRGKACTYHFVRFTDIKDTPLQGRLTPRWTENGTTKEFANFLTSFFGPDPRPTGLRGPLWLWIGSGSDVTS